MKLCDLHTHVLPGADDGAPNLEYALQMLHNAAASDVTLLAVTPHCSEIFGNYLTPELKQKFSELQQAAQDIPVELVLGAEARVDDAFLSALSRRQIPTINSSRYLLLEFSANERDFEESLRNTLELGYIPLIAHPERYAAVCRNPGIVVPWLDMGCHLQLTGGSILGEYGKTVQRTAAILLKNDLVACVASDAHGLHHRSNFLMDVCDHLSVQYSKQYANCLLYENPLRICRNEDI
jgi:protein-tyrosine phosphatase